MNKRTYITVESIILVLFFVLFTSFSRKNVVIKECSRQVTGIQHDRINGYVINNGLSKGTNMNFSIAFPQDYMNDEIVFMYSYIPMNKNMKLFDLASKHIFDHVILNAPNYETSFSIHEDGFYTFYIMNASLNKEITYHTAFSYYNGSRLNE